MDKMKESRYNRMPRQVTFGGSGRPTFLYGKSLSLRLPLGMLVDWAAAWAGFALVISSTRAGGWLVARKPLEKDAMLCRSCDVSGINKLLTESESNLTLASRPLVSCGQHHP